MSQLYAHASSNFQFVREKKYVFLILVAKKEGLTLHTVLFSSSIVVLDQRTVIVDYCTTLTLLSTIFFIPNLHNLSKMQDASRDSLDTVKTIDMRN